MFAAALALQINVKAKKLSSTIKKKKKDIYVEE